VYSLLDDFGNVIFNFKDDGSIVNSGDKKIGFVKDGNVFDLDGTPSRATISGSEIVWSGVNPGPQLQVIGILVNEITGNTTDAIVVGGSGIAATSVGERMIAALAYWEFVWSKT
jgi:hypothetical protein